MRPTTVKKDATLAEVKAIPVAGDFFVDAPLIWACHRIAMDKSVSMEDRLEALHYYSESIMGLSEPYPTEDDLYEYLHFIND